VPRALLGLFLCFGVLLTGCSSTESAGTGIGAGIGTGIGAGAVTTAPSAARSAVPVPPWADGMKTVDAARLPAEARETLALIDKGGPFPYARDGIVFGNFEGLLPKHQRGYYHEYTVKTPGAHDRGARRIVTGQGGEIYYTGDHYKSFRAVLR
jgi:ribonuclease T1